ncbi:ABC transporter permease [Nonomuraea sp. NPDC049625]|uniref:ABC transporter permease n=1 Tax=Nonomuraea sp. NPDC049625 TaxID=3155775 RepID=UPI0034404763
MTGQPVTARDRDTAKTRGRDAVKARGRGVVKRVLAGLAVLWAAASASYVALLLAPGDTIDILVGDGPDTPEIRARIVAEWGLDRPEVVQYVSYLWRLLHGDLGRSYQLQLGVGEILSTQLGPTLQLTLAAAGVGVSLAGVIAVVTAGRGRWLRGAASAAELVSVSVPPFLIGLVLLAVFSFTLGWFPVSGASGPQALVLPALALGLPIAGVLGQVLRGGLERALEQPFAVTARARGLSEPRLVARHALRHALIPAVTLAGWFTGTLLGGAVITEVLFGRPGLGQVAMQAVTGRDMPVVMAVVLLSAIVYVTISTLLDLAYRAIDPRIGGRP